jgi:threonine dehydrogenase-like Zn-dependent dehydrogenase
MKATIFLGPGKIEVQEVPDPVIQQPDDAIVKVTYSCICGSDLWPYRGLAPRDHGSRIGHEFMGVVETVGADVKKVKPGDLVVAPFIPVDGTCPECLAGMYSACRNKKTWGSGGNDGCQGEKIRVPLADGTLFKIPKDTDEKLMSALLPLSDVLCTGHHAAVSAGVGPGKTVAVVGDGAVGLCAVAASKRLGAKQIILISTHEDRARVGRQFGATEILAKRGDEAIAAIKAETNNLGVDCALECVGTPESWKTVFGVVRPGGRIGFVGVPVNVPDIAVRNLLATNIGVQGGIAPAATYIPQLMPDVLSGKLDVSAIFTKTLPLSEIAQGYKDMDERKEIKILIKL